jgi:hypothetical protein
MDLFTSIESNIEIESVRDINLYRVSKGRILRLVSLAVCQNLVLGGKGCIVWQDASMKNAQSFGRIGCFKPVNAAFRYHSVLVV